MKRRAFIKTMGLGGAAVYIPSTLTLTSLLNEAYAAGPDYSQVNYIQPAVFPQVINIFLYGGPSELSGNLSNMLPVNGDLNAHSQVSYSSQLGTAITRLQNDNNGLISQRGFWIGAGGAAMEFLASQGYMSVYRTMMQRRGSTQSHRDSIFMNQKGTMDLENSPGIGTRIAKVLQTQFEAGALTAFDPAQLILPFVSFEGETVFYAPDPDRPLNTLTMKPVTMRFANNQFDNPYTRGSDGNGPALNALVDTVETAAVRSRFSKVRDSFRQRALMEAHLASLAAALSSALPVMNDPIDTAADFNAGTGRLVYPNNSFSNQIRAAVTLAIENPDTKFITVSNGGLGGFDDHNNGTDNYPQRMENLFNTLRAAMKHIKYANGNTPGGLARNTNNIIINVFGDFGRRVNLNDSLGWDHGNCQILYTLGGSAVRPGGVSALGKVVGSTRRTGQSGSNDQYLVPQDSSYEFEPMSLAASIYRYFGVQNTQVLTSDPVHHPGGHQPINEGVAGEPLLFT
jgi:hypothetical protein